MNCDNPSGAPGIVSTEWLERHLADSNLRIYDTTMHLIATGSGTASVKSGRADYEVAHIPGAAFLDLAADLSDHTSRFRFTMPPVEAVTRVMSAAGLSPGVKVVLYSSTTPMWATRLWWMLRACGFDDAAVLDGGLPKWRAESRTVEKGSCCYPAAGIGFAPRPEMWADRAAVLAATEDARVCIINALPAESHAGVGAPQYGRPGHIKSSLSVPYQRLLTNEGQFRPDSELRELFDDIGAFSASKVICYCGGGIAATAEALALVRLGHPSVAVYDGSLVEWSQDPTLPMGIDVGSADAHA